MSMIFVSYRREDSSGHAGRLYDRLANHFGKDNVFRDIDHIQYGEDFVAALNKAVGSCNAFVPVIGPTWLSSQDKRGRRRLENANDFVRIEIESALSQGVPIIPVLVNNAEMPDTEDLPNNISELARRQALEISDTRIDYDVKQLINVLETKVGPAQGASESSKPERNIDDKPEQTPVLAKELRDEPLPPSVRQRLASLKTSVQLRFLDYYEPLKRSKRTAYILLLLPLPILGLHNVYLGALKRASAFWLISGLFVFFFIASPPGEVRLYSLIAMCIWPAIDLFLLPEMVIKRNESIAREIVFGGADPENTPES